MTPIQKTEAIRSACASGLPILLTTAGLDDLDQYLNKSPTKSDDNELAVYIDFDDNNVSDEQFQVIIQIQLSGQDKTQEYHSVIMPFLKSAITEDLVKMQVRDSIKSDHYPMPPNGGNSYIFYVILFSSELDDCN